MGNLVRVGIWTNNFIIMFIIDIPHFKENGGLGVFSGNVEITKVNPFIINGEVVKLAI